MLLCRHIQSFILHMLLSCLLLCCFNACNQRPLDVAPETEFGTWRPAEGLAIFPYGNLSGSSGSNIYGTTEITKLIHYNGSTWSEIDGPGPSNINDVWVASDNDLFAISRDEVFHYDGATWTTLYDQGHGYLRSIWGLSVSDIFIAAINTIIHFNGSSWDVDTLAPGSQVYDVWGTSASDVFAVGYDQLILRNDGSGWSEMHRGDGYLWEIRGSGPNDVYAAGYPDLLYYDGNDWTSVSLPVYWPIHINALWVAAKDDVFVFYGYGDILHYNGIEWQIMNSNTGMSLNSAWGTAPDNIYAVGQNAKIIHYDGIGWSSVSGGSPRYFDYVWGLDAGNIYVGNSFSVFHYNGTEFEELPTVIGRTSTNDIWGTSPTNIISVGDSGKVFHFDGTGWNRADVPTSRRLNAITGVAADAVWAVGADMTCIYYDGNNWTTIYKDIDGEEFNDVWAASRSRAFMVGSGGTLAHLDDTVWHFVDSGVEELYGIWGTSSSNVYAVGEDAILHFDGSSWERMLFPIPPRTHSSIFTAIGGTHPEDIFAGSYWNGIYHFNGSVWSLIPSSNSFDKGIVDLWISPMGDAFAVVNGIYGLTVYRR